LLCNSSTTVSDIPSLDDVITICKVIESLGADVRIDDGRVNISPGRLLLFEAPYELVRKMRASILVMGPLLARTGRAKISLPGGCAIGSRPIDLHLKGFAALGAEVKCEHGFVEAKAKKLRGAQIYLDYPSVGATENIMMAAVMAEGQTLIENAAEEPEIVDLANYLNSLGGNIKGAGTPVIKIEGVKELTGTNYTVIPDRIEAGTYMVAAAITGGNVLIKNVIVDHLKPVIAKLNEAGIIVKEEERGIRVIAEERPRAIDIKTLPYPGFPTDMQAQMTSLLAVADGTSIITETVFENRFMHVAELKRMGARIKIDGRTTIVEGVYKLTGAQVSATDLRAGAALIIAGLAADGTTEISNVHHIDRGYEDIEHKLQEIGADIRRIP
ncbi:MAG TPA: UDP-N-acetylglucosamine 1-carboxyvinyltransferase, partial [Clostridia bacterium]|nr:UDP-N-acetylglucosamine 1-carboxyvinyltransferase [Clostridia bacterium]